MPRSCRGHVFCRVQTILLTILLIIFKIRIIWKKRVKEIEKKCKKRKKKKKDALFKIEEEKKNKQKTGRKEKRYI